MIEKCGSKELIMTCIVELICRGNIQNIDNDKFKLISTNNLSDYEEQLVTLLFDKNTIISFSQINEMFITNNEKTSIFIKEFKEIKKKILNKLYSLDIYSKLGEYILKIIRKISILIYVNIFMLVRNIIANDSSNFIKILSINVITLLITYLVDHLKNNNKQISIKRGRGFSLAFGIITLLILNIMLLFSSFSQHYIILTMLAIIIILNTIIFCKSKLHILTKTGREEYAKVYGLKSYILDFSIMKENDIDSAIIWDEYLAYAVAFSIPNKITNKFNSALMESNIILQNIDKFITS